MSSARVRFTERLRLEPIEPRHTDDLFALFRDPAVAAWYGSWTHEQIEAEAARIAGCWHTDGVHKWMAYHRITGQLIGRGGLSLALVEDHTRLEVGWALHQRHWGQRYATEVGRAGLVMAFDELGAREVVSFTEPHNHRSRAVMNRLGFSYSKNITIDDQRFALYLLHHAAQPATSTASLT